MRRLPKSQPYCTECAYAETCLAVAHLKTLAINRPALQSDYGWDVFGFIAEAKREYRMARERQCPTLTEVRMGAKELAPEVDFRQMK